MAAVSTSSSSHAPPVHPQLASARWPSLHPVTERKAVATAAKSRARRPPTPPLGKKAKRVKHEDEEELQWYADADASAATTAKVEPKAEIKEEVPSASLADGMARIVL